MALWLYMIWAFRGQPGDDPFITYHYAANLASGAGFVFNVGEHVQSTTTPLFTVLLAAGGTLGLDIPWLGYLLGGLCLLAFAFCCVGLLSDVLGGSGRWLGLATAALTFVCPVTTYGLGTEMPLLIALAWASWWAAARDRWVLAALPAALAALTRGDGVLVGLSVALVFLYKVTSHKSQVTRQRKTQNAKRMEGTPNAKREAQGTVHRWFVSPNAGRSSLRFAFCVLGAVALYLAIVLPWYLFAWAYFGSPLPATLGAKLAQGSAPGTMSFLEGLSYFWARSSGDNPLLWVPALALLVVGVVALVRLGVRLAPVWIWAALFIAGFGLLHVPRYPWYYSPLVPVAMLALVLGAITLERWNVGTLERWKAGKPSYPKVLPEASNEPTAYNSQRSNVQTFKRSNALIVLLVCVLVGVVYLANDIRAQRPEPLPRSLLFVDAARWLRDNTPPGASVGAEEVGFLGYYSHRRIIDFVGLIQPDVAPRRAAGDNLYVLRTYRPDYILAMPAWMAAVGAHPSVQAEYEVVRTFERPGVDTATLLKRKSE